MSASKKPGSLSSLGALCRQINASQCPCRHQSRYYHSKPRPLDIDPWHLSDPRGQLYSLIPWIFLGKRDPVSTRLNQLVKEQLDGIEAILYVVDPTRNFGEEEEAIQKLLKQLPIPLFVVINKSDLPLPEQTALKAAREIMVGQREIIEVSARTGKNLPQLVIAIFSVLPEGEAFYPDQQLTDVGNKEWLEELVREKVFMHLDQELPYTIKVEVMSDSMRKELRAIEATVWTTEDRYKGMIIGAKGQMLKQIGMEVRRELELVTGQKVFLRLEVAVDAKWPQRFV